MESIIVNVNILALHTMTTRILLIYDRCVCTDKHFKKLPLTNAVVIRPGLRNKLNAILSKK